MAVSLMKLFTTALSIMTLRIESKLELIESNAMDLFNCFTERRFSKCRCGQCRSAEKNTRTHKK